MKILITGASGQLGSEIVRMLSSGQSELGALPSVYDGAEITAVDVAEADITDSSAIFELVKNVKPDIIFNCAAMTAVDACQDDPETAMRVNALGPRNLAIAAEHVGAALVHVSTDYVFSGDASVPYREWDVCSPSTVYGKSKLLGEHYVEQFCSRYFIVRTAWLYGLKGKNFVKTMRRLGAERPIVKVVNDQRGNPTNAEDLAYHLLLLAAGHEYGLYHCTGQGECSWFDFARRIMELSGLDRCIVEPCSTAEYAAAAPRPAYSSLDNLMLRVTVGDRMRGWDEALQSYIRRLDQSERGV